MRKDKWSRMHLSLSSIAQIYRFDRRLICVYRKPFCARMMCTEKFIDSAVGFERVLLHIIYNLQAFHYGCSLMLNRALMRVMDPLAIRYENSAFAY